MSSDHAESHPHTNYFLVFGALCVFTAISVIFDVIELSKGLTVAAVMAVAVMKALCVMLFFMHLKFEGRWKYVLLLPTCILAVGLPLALAPDIGLHYYTPDVPQVRDFEAMMQHKPGHTTADRLGVEEQAHDAAVGGGSH